MNYEQLLITCCPRIIHNGAEYERQLQVRAKLQNTEGLDAMRMIDVFNLTIGEWERKSFPNMKITGREKILQLMSQNGVTQSQLARDLDVSRNLVSLVVRGKRMVSVRMARKLSERFGVDVAEFLQV